MIEVLFEMGSEIILVVIRGKDVKFGTSSYGCKLADISGLKLDYVGVCREFPDLELRDDWKEEAIYRFKEKIKELKSEIEISKYIIDELSKSGYKAKSMQRGGFRPVKL